MIVVGCIEHSSYLAGNSMESDINSNDKTFEWQQISSKVIWNFVSYFMFVCQRTLGIAFCFFIFSTTQPTYHRTLSCLSYANQSNIADNLSADIKVDSTNTKWLQRVLLINIRHSQNWTFNDHLFFDLLICEHFNELYYRIKWTALSDAWNQLNHF